MRAQPNASQNQTLLLIQQQQKLSTLATNLKTLTQQLNSTKDIMRKYRQKSLPCLLPNPQLTFQAQQGVYCLSSGNFFHEVPLNKLVQYFEARVEGLVKAKRKVEGEIGDTLRVFVGWLKEGKVGFGELDEEAKVKVRDFMEELEDNEDN